jgi:hypothetical protein
MDVRQYTSKNAGRWAFQIRSAADPFELHCMPHSIFFGGVDCFQYIIVGLTCADLRRKFVAGHDSEEIVGW